MVKNNELWDWAAGQSLLEIGEESELDSIEEEDEDSDEDDMSDGFLACRTITPHTQSRVAPPLGLWFLHLRRDHTSCSWLSDWRYYTNSTENAACRSNTSSPLQHTARINRNSSLVLPRISFRWPTTKRPRSRTFRRGVKPLKFDNANKL